MELGVHAGELGAARNSGGNEWLLSWELISVAYCWGFKLSSSDHANGFHEHGSLSGW
jgi:hypothetical protein